MNMPKPPRKAVAYGRVSTPNQDELLSVDTQGTHMDRVSAERGFQILKLFRETGSGTSDLKRTEFQAMIRYVLDPNHGIEALFIYDPSRYTRDIADFYFYLRRLTNAGIEVHSVTIGQYIPGNETSEILWGFNALFNSLMPSQSARKTRDSQYEATKKGYYLSPKTPFGYKKYKVMAGGKEHTKLEPHPEQWEHAKKMWEMGLDKYTPMDVARYNNSLGIRNNQGNEWTDANVREFYRQPAHRGATVRGKRQKKQTDPKRRAVGSMRKRASSHGDSRRMGQDAALHRGKAQRSGRTQESQQSQSAQREDLLRALRVTHARPHE
jgi:site-specific DNA recombinase